MQTTIDFALFCEAFIGGVSSAHGEILSKKMTFPLHFFIPGRLKTYAEGTKHITGTGHLIPFDLSLRIITV